jgi:hypothetical protein
MYYAFKQRSASHSLRVNEPADALCLVASFDASGI